MNNTTIGKLKTDRYDCTEWDRTVDIKVYADTVLLGVRMVTINPSADINSQLLDVSDLAPLNQMHNPDFKVLPAYLQGSLGAIDFADYRSDVDSVISIAVPPLVAPVYHFERTPYYSIFVDYLKLH